MLFIVLAVVCLLNSVSAFAPAGRAGVSTMKMMEDRSIALPMDRRPPNLDGSLAGDVGFDPAGFSNNPPKQWLIGGEERSLKWYREAEIVHGRVAQLAVIGNLFPALYHFPTNGFLPEGTFAELNPYTALSTVPAEGLWQISLVIFGIELARTKRIIRGDKEPGDLGLGQTGFNPFGFEYTEEEYREKQVQEIKHGRLAMFGALGMLLQTSVSGQGITQQLGGAFTWPEALEIQSGMGTLGDYFPPNL